VVPSFPATAAPDLFCQSVSISAIGCAFAGSIVIKLPAEPFCLPNALPKTPDFCSNVFRTGCTMNIQLPRFGPAIPGIFRTSLLCLLLVATWPTPGVTRADLIYFSGNNDDVWCASPPDAPSLLAQLPVYTNVEGVAFDSHGSLFVAGGANVSKVSPDGTVSLFANLPFSAGGYGMTIDHANNLYVADAFIHQISRIDPAGNVSLFATLGASGPTGLAIDENGFIYANTAETITRISPDGGTISTYWTLPEGFNNTYGLAFDSEGYLYASDLFANSIFRIAPGGGSFTSFGNPGSGAKGLAFDSLGNLYVAQPYNNSISMISPDGTTSIYATGLNAPRYLAFAPTAVPEPSALAILAGGVGCLATLRRRRMDH
jgi:sugar lactone lactonase YvrE